MIRRAELGTLLVLVLMGGAPGLPQAAGAYEVDPSLQGATVHGSVTLNGSLPRSKPLPVHRDSSVCGTTMPDEALTVDRATRGILGVIVSLEGITRGKPLPDDEPVTIENLACRFISRVNASLVGNIVRIKNSDPILHNTHIRRETRFGNTVINVAQPVGSPVIEKDLEDPGYLDVSCDAHTFMQASLHVFEHPYFAVTDEQGGFTLTHVPAGTYRLKLWHEVLGVQEQDVTVPPSGELSLDLELGRLR